MIEYLILGKTAKGTKRIPDCRTARRLNLSKVNLLLLFFHEVLYIPFISGEAGGLAPNLTLEIVCLPALSGGRRYVLLNMWGGDETTLVGAKRLY